MKLGSKIASATAAIVLSSLTASVLMTGPASATPLSQAPQTPPQSAVAPALSENSIRALLNAVDASRTFDGARARAQGASAADVSQFAAGYVARGGEIRHAEPDLATLEELDRSPMPFACKGKNRYDFTGYQGNLYMNSCVSGDVIGKLSAGAGAAAIIGLISAETGIGGLGGGLVAGLLAIGAGLLGSCASKGTGTVVHYIPFPMAYWCTAQ